MGKGETERVAVYASLPSELELLAGLVREAGGWDIIPIHWQSSSRPVAASRQAQAVLLHTGEAGRPADDLVAALGARPAHQPLIVVGHEPARRASPTLWLPTVPSAPLLGQVLEQLVGVAREQAPSDGPTWRRKSDMIIGDSPAIREVLHALDQLAASQTPVLVTGESGVGKELVARSLHYCGPRARAPFIAINCAAIPENLIEAELFGYQRGAFTGAVSPHAGAFEAAHEGTLFLDEIGEMPLAMQAKLLRVLETSEVQRIGATERKMIDFRLVTATNRNLELEVKHGRFRADLYYRVLVYPIHVPPLRERLEDLPRLVTHHLSTIGARDRRAALRLSPAALQKLLGHAWPGNVRELVNVLERAALVAQSSVIDGEHISFSQATADGESVAPSLLAYRDAKARFEHDYFVQLMRAAGGNVSLAAKLGQKTRKEVYDGLRRCGLDTMGNPIVKRRRARTLGP